MRYLLNILLIFGLVFPAFASDYEYKELNVYSGQPDCTWKESSIQTLVDDSMWLVDPVEDSYDPTGGLPADPTVGDRYISDDTANGWTIDYIYEWDGTSWEESIPEEGWMVWMLLDLLYYVFFSGGWMEVGSGTYLSLDGESIDVTNGTFDLTTTGDISVGAATVTSLTDGTATLTGGDLTGLGSLVVDTTTLVVNAAGYEDKVGIGTDSPDANLEISNADDGAGDTYLHISKGYDSTAALRKAGIVLGSDSSNLGSNWTMEFDSSFGYMDHGKLNFIHNSGGTESVRMTMLDTGNVGIGTNNPFTTLDVDGSINIPTTTSTEGIIYQNEDIFLHAYGTNNLFMGLNSGNLSTTSNTNTGFGAYTLYALTTGSYNTAIGKSALQGVTTGQQNIAVGFESLISNTTGTYNVGIGRGTLRQNITGQRNVAIGNESLRNSTGSYNVGIGAFAGYRQSTGSNQLFISGGTLYADAATEKTNSIIYGVTAATPENQILSLNANVGIGTTSPATKLDVNGITTFRDAVYFTQTDGNEYIDSLNDGYLDIGATTGIRLLTDTVVTGSVDASTGFKDNGTAGIDGSWVNAEGDTVTVSGGIIIAITAP